MFRAISFKFQIENSVENSYNFRENIKLTCKPINFLKNLGSLHQDTFSILYFYVENLWRPIFWLDYFEKVLTVITNKWQICDERTSLNFVTWTWLIWDKPHWHNTFVIGENKWALLIPFIDIW